MNLHSNTSKHAELMQHKKIWEQDIQFDHTILGQTLHFHSTWGIFSPEKIDEGSLLLLDHIDFKKDMDSIDLGCGYGVLGMTAAKMCPQGQHLLIDKDFVAIEYSKKNLTANNILNATAQLSNGFGHVNPTQQFDLVMSNLPAKASKEQHYLYLLNAYQHMRVGAVFYVVTINGLREFMARSFKEVFGNSSKLKQGKTYTISMAVKE